MTKTTYWTTDRIMKLIIGIAIGIILIIAIRYLSDVLLPFFVACFLAYLMQPFVEFNRKLLHVKGRTLPSIMTLAEVIGIIVGLAYLFMPHVISELDTLDKIIHDIETGKRALPHEYAVIASNVQRYFSPAEIKTTLSELHIDTLLSKGSSLLGESISVILQILGWAMTIIYLLFILIDYPQISRGFKLLIPYKYREGAMTIVHDAQDNLNHYFRGQGLVALCATVLYSVGFTIIGLPLGIPMGILVGLLYMIPYFQYITLIPVALICGIYSFGGDGTFISLFGKSLLVYVVSQSICDYILTPHIMGKEMGLNAAIILLSLSVWGSLMGIIGMIVALPLTSLIMSYYEQYISNPKDKSNEKI